MYYIIDLKYMGCRWGLYTPQRGMAVLSSYHAWKKKSLNKSLLSESATTCMCMLYAYEFSIKL